MIKNSLTPEELENVNGGLVKINPSGSCDGENKYFILDDMTGAVLAVTGGYRNARKIAESLGQSPELSQ